MAILIKYQCSDDMDMNDVESCCGGAQADYSGPVRGWLRLGGLQRGEFVPTVAQRPT
jgi:hypothetical protein